MDMFMAGMTVGSAIIAIMYTFDNTLPRYTSRYIENEKIILELEKYNIYLENEIETKEDEIVLLKAQLENAIYKVELFTELSKNVNDMADMPPLIPMDNNSIPGGPL